MTYTNPGPGEIAITLDNVVENNFFVEVMYMGTSCTPGTCSDNVQFDVLFDQFPNGTNTHEFGVPGAGTYYFALASQGDGVTSVDITITCQATGIEADGGCSGLDMDADGLITTWNGSLEPPVYDASAGGTRTVCHTIYLRNPGFEWLKYVDIELGSCWISPRSFNPNGGNSGMNSYCFSGPPPRRGSWIPTLTTGSDTIQWAYYPGSCMFSGWGDGNLLGSNYSCAAYTFCYTADIDPGCTDPSGFQDKIIAIDDGIGGGGSTGASTEFFGADALNNAPLYNEESEFHATWTGELVELKWTAPNDPQVDYYQLEHSFGNEPFEAFAKVKPQISSSDLLTYDFFQSEDLSGVYKYRVRAVLKNQLTTTTDIQLVNIPVPEAFTLESIHPQPAKDKMTLSISSPEIEIAHVYIVDASGRNISHEWKMMMPGMNEFEMNVNDLAPGIYLLRLGGSMGYEVRRFLIQ